MAFSAIIALAVQLIITASAWAIFSIKTSVACFAASFLSIGVVLIDFAQLVR
jgi:hypothetical protein